MLSERVTSRTADNELAIDVTVTGGSDNALCGVGSVVHLSVANGRLAMSSTPSTPSVVTDRVGSLHADLGKSDALTLGGHRLPTDGTETRKTIDGIEYVDLRIRDSRDLGDYPSTGTSFTATVVRRRASDRRVACGWFTLNAHGTNFEYGGWSQNTQDSLEIDYGDKLDAHCAEIGR